MKIPNILHFWPWILELASVLGASAWAWMRIRQAYSWPSVQGTVWQARAHVGAEGSRFRRSWVAEFVYSYTVGGQYYSGTHQIRAWSERRAEEKIAGWKDRMVVVRHHPSKLEVSVLLAGDQVGGQLGN